MAYTGKIGLDYFPLDVNFFDDDKIELIEGEFGAKGVVITLKLLCKIYKEGYFYKWGEDECLLFAKRAGAGIVPQLVDEVVKGLLRRSIFDKSVFEQFGILTSRGIQHRYMEAAERRKSVYINGAFLLADVSKFKNVYIVDSNDNISYQNDNILRQSKVKESKVKESNGDARNDVYISDSGKDQSEANAPPVAPPPPRQNKGPCIEAVTEFFTRAGGTEEMAKGFWNKWESVDWMNGVSAIRNWTPLANNYIATWHRNDEKDQKHGPGRKQTVTSSIEAIDAATADIIRDLDEAARIQHEG